MKSLLLAVVITSAAVAECQAWGESGSVAIPRRDLVIPQPTLLRSLRTLRTPQVDRGGLRNCTSNFGGELQATASELKYSAWECLKEIPEYYNDFWTTVRATVAELLSSLTEFIASVKACSLDWSCLFKALVSSKLKELVPELLISIVTVANPFIYLVGCYWPSLLTGVWETFLDAMILLQCARGAGVKF